uniref:Uncharacterized protein n=1 Tax=Oryza nivara TaxID=4536 RepID=A0A0E0FQ42_ORYNI
MASPASPRREEEGKKKSEGEEETGESVFSLCLRACAFASESAKFRFEEEKGREEKRRALPSLCGVSEQAIGSVPTVQDEDYFTKDPDFVLEPPASSDRESTPASDNATSPDSDGTNSAGPARSRIALQLDQRSLHFSVTAWVLIVALIGILPLTPRQLQYKGYRLSLLGTTCTTGYALFAFYRLPRAGNMHAAQIFHHVASSKDFIPFMYCLMFVMSKLHLKLICWALEHVARFLRRHFTNSSLYRRQRNPMQTFMYWQLLKLMYHSPFTAGYHRAIWLKIGRTVNPYIHRYTPFLHDPINAGMRWWFR